MSRPAPEILVCSQELDVCIRIRGRADATASVAFKELLHELRERHFKHYELELSDCQIMDSTFLGVLCGFAQKCEAEPAGAQRKPILFNANNRVTGLLTSLGVDEMFDFCQGNPVNRGPCEPFSSPSDEPSRERVGSTSLEAHKTLMSLNPENIPKFKDLTEFLAEDLKKLRSNT